MKTRPKQASAISIAIVAARIACQRRACTDRHVGRDVDGPGAFAIGPGSTDIGNNLQRGHRRDRIVDSVRWAGFSPQARSASATAVPASAMVKFSFRLCRNQAGADGDGFSPGMLNRFRIRQLGREHSCSAEPSSTARQRECLAWGTNHCCNNFIGNAAGSTGTFTLTGAGTSVLPARLRRRWCRHLPSSHRHLHLRHAPGSPRAGSRCWMARPLRNKGTKLSAAPTNPARWEPSAVRRCGDPRRRIDRLVEARTPDNLPALLTTGNGPNS